MKCIINVYLLNEHFSPEHAEAHYGGEESENNLKYEWEDEFAITTPVIKIDVHPKGIYPLRGTLADGKEFSYEVENMLLFEIVAENGTSMYVGASSSIVDNYNLTELEDRFEIKMYLKDYEPMANPIPGIYIASQEFPKDLHD